ncbi:MAG: universal stress protein [Phycisphaerae bacterium]|nr:universal stress protein [Phycisphaerae bacterium]
MDAIKTILVAVDFSPCSLDAARAALRIAAWNRAAVIALHVVEPFVYSPELLPLVPTPAERGRDAERQWRDFAASEPAAAAQFRAVVGHPVAAILAEARQCNADLLVLGEHSVIDAHRGIGHVASGCVQKAPCKVLLVKQGQRGPFRRITVAVAGTPTCSAAIEAAVRIGAQDHAAVELFHAYEDPWRSGQVPRSVLDAAPDIRQRIQEGQAERLRAFAKPFEHELNSLKASVAVAPDRSHAAAIIARVRETASDLLIIGTRARWNLRDAFLGSTAARVVRAAPCSVLAIKPAGFEPPEPQPAPRADLVSDAALGFSPRF